MPEDLPGDKLRWQTQFVSAGMDFIVFEEITNEAAKRLTPGDAHPQGKYQGYKFAACEPVGQKGQRAYYLKTRDEQWKYNAERAQALGDDLPRLSFTWVVLRSEYYANGTVPAIPSGQMPTFGGAFTWALTGQRTNKMPMPFDGLFLEVIHDYYDTTHPLRSEEIDQETGELRSVTRALVPRSQAGHTINASGEVATYEAINSTHGWLVTRKASGGKGSMVNGRKTIITRGVKSHFWPKVLKFIGLYPVHEDSSSIYTRVVDWIVTKVFACEDYNGECKITRVKRYTTKEPIFGGDPAWTSASPPEVSPDIPVPVPLLERAIDFRGKNLTVQCEPCLRQAYTFFDEGFAQFFPASSPMFWPESRLVDVDVYQEDGAHVTELLYVDAPDGAGRSSGLDLTQRAAALATSVQVAWTPAVGAAGPVLTKIDVALDPEFETGFLPGFRDKTLSPVSNSPTDTWTTITGMTRGQPYFVRVRTAAYTVGQTNYPALTSNTLVVMGKPSPELEARVNGVPVTGLDFGSIAQGETGRITLQLASIGLITVRAIDAVITGAGDAVYGVDDPVNELAPGATGTVEVRFKPTALGSIAATLTITSEAGELVLSLAGIGIGPEILVEQPTGTGIASGGTVAFGTVTTGSVARAFRVRNTGSAPLTGLALSIAGTNAEDFTVTSALSGSSIAPAGQLEFTVTFDPVESEDAFGARAAVLTIASNDADENPTTINLTGTSASPTAPGTLDTGYNPNANGAVRAVALQPDGKTIYAGDFTTIAGTARNRIARVNADGTLDSGFNPNANGIVRCVIVQPDGTILMGGDFTTIGGTARNRIALLNADGTLAAWYPTGGVDAGVWCMARKSNGAVWIGGPFNTVGGATRKRIALINANATINATDPSVALGIAIPAVADVRAIVLDTAERLVISGYYFQVFAWGFVARLLADGTVDGTFIGQVYFNGPVNAVAVLPDGRVVAGGSFATMNSVIGTFPAISPGAPVYNRANVIVLDSAGVPTADVLDANGAVQVLALQADGRALIGGAFTTLAGVGRLRIARLREDLTLEAAFDPSANGAVLALALQETGEILAGGDFTSMGGTSRNYAARLLNSAAVQALTVPSASTVRWLVSGSFPASQRVSFEVDTGSGYGALGGTLAGIAGGWEVTGLSLAGVGTIRARSVGTDGHSSGLIEEVRAYDVSPEIAISTAGGGIASGDTLAFGNVQTGKTLDIVITITNTGLDDLTLSGTPKAALSGTHAAQWSVVAQPDSPIAPGLSASFTLRISPTSEGAKTAALTIASDDADEASFVINLTGTATPGVGSVDTSYMPVVNGDVHALAGDWLAGKFTVVNGLNRGRFARMNSAGSVQSQAGAGANGPVYAVCHLLDGKVIIGGDFTAVHGVARAKLARLNADGTLDTTFNVPVTGGFAYVTCLALCADGSVIVGGAFTTIAGGAQPNLARLTAAGAWDSSWRPSRSFVYALAIQPDGKILAGGEFPNVQRYNVNGSTDATFTAPGASDTVFALKLQADGKVLVMRRDSVVRLTATGALDNDWTTATRGAGALELQADGAVMIGTQSAFTTHALKRYTSAGVVDTSFAAYAGSGVLSLALASDGKLMVGGGAVRTLLRLLNDPATSALTTTAARVQWLRGGTKAEAQWTAFDLSEDGGTIWTRLGTGTRITGGWELAGLALPSAGRIRARAFVGGALQDDQLVFSGLPVPDLDVTRLVTGAAAASVADGGSVAFAGVLPTQTSDVTLKLRNSGLATLSGLTLTMTGAEFTVISLDLTSLEPGQVATAIIRCTPSATGQRSGTLDITSNVPGVKAVYRIGLTGFGITNPAAITDAATLITSTAARLPVRVTANADVATAYVRYRRAVTPRPDWTLTPVPAWDIAGFTASALSRDVGSLIPATTYEFQAVAINAVSTKEGTLRTFTTLA